MNKKQILNFFRENKNIKRNSSFYVGDIDLNNQFIGLQINTKQHINIISISDYQIVFMIEKIKPFEELEFIYTQEFKDLKNQNKQFINELNKLELEQKQKFILNAEKRLKNIIGKKIYFKIENKKQLEDFYLKIIKD